MAGNLQPLVNTQRIVNLDGTPNDYFIRWAQQRQIDIGNGITAAQALEIIQQFTADHPLVAGSGIILTPSGDLADDVHIGASVQAILDQITTTRGSVLYRGASGWAGLAPGTAGQVLQANGAGTDPTWATLAGGGGALVKINQAVVAVATNTINFASIPATYEDLIIVLNGQLSGSADFVWGSLNGDVTVAHYRWARGVFQNSGLSYTSGTNVGLDMGLIGGASAGASFADSLEATIYGYARTTFFKKAMARSTLCFGTAANQTTTEIQASDWLSTAAVNAIALKANSGNFTVGTVATLYGRG